MASLTLLGAGLARSTNRMSIRTHRTMFQRTVACLVVSLFAVAAAGSPREDAASRRRAAQVFAQLARADRAKRPTLLKRFVSSLARRREVDDATLGFVAWNVGRLYQQTDDDAILEAFLASGLVTAAAETAHGALAEFLENAPDLVRRHPRAATFLHDERGGRILGTPIRIPSLEDADKRCRSRESGYPIRLRAGTDPSAAVALDGKPTGLTTPIGGIDRIELSPGRHRISFTTSTRTISVDIDVPPPANGCVYRVLGS